jgi:excinuclease ABC subunit A
MVREELAKYLNNKPCPDCAGTRCGARRVTSRSGLPDNQRTIFELSHLPLKEAQAFFLGAGAFGQRAQIADKISQGSR